MAILEFIPNFIAVMFAPVAYSFYFVEMSKCTMHLIILNFISTGIALFSCLRIAINVALCLSDSRNSKTLYINYSLFFWHFHSIILAINTILTYI